MPDAEMPNQVFSRQFGFTIQIEGDGEVELGIGGGAGLAFSSKNIIGADVN